MFEFVQSAWDWLWSWGDWVVYLSGVGVVFGAWGTLKILRANKLPRDYDSDMVSLNPAIYERAEVAARAYLEDSTESPSDLRLGGLSAANGYETRLLHDKENHLQALLLTNRALKLQIVAFRGTVTEDRGEKTMSNVIFDADARWLAVPTLGRFHRGFWRATALMMAMIKPYLEDGPGWTFETLGHSLGGAMAVDCAIELAAGGRTVVRVTTFGQPRVTDRAGAERWGAELRVTRVVNDKDPVALAPVPLPWNAVRVNSWMHFGNVLVLANDNGGMRPLSPYEARAVGVDSIYYQWFTLQRKFWQPGHEASDHKMANYLASLRPLLPKGALA